MSVYKAIASAAEHQGKVEMPDGVVYPVTALSIGDEIKLERLTEQKASNADAAEVYVDLIAKNTGCPRDVVAELGRAQIVHVLSIARYGYEAVAHALSAEASASGNGKAPAAAPKSRRSTSRSKR